MERRVKILALLCLLLIGCLTVRGQKRPDQRDAREPVPQAGVLSLTEPAEIPLKATPGPVAPLEMKQETVIRVPEQAGVTLNGQDRVEQEPLIRLIELVRVQTEPPLTLQEWMICCTDWRRTSR